jgi:excisionase family DNA binding protein
VTLTEAAQSLRLSPATLRQQIAAGKLRATKWGRDWMVEPEEIERYRREHLRKDGVA